MNLQLSIFIATHPRRCAALSCNRVRSCLLVARTPVCGQYFANPVLSNSLMRWDRVRPCRRPSSGSTDFPPTRSTWRLRGTALVTRGDESASCRARTNRPLYRWASSIVWTTRAGTRRNHRSAFGLESRQRRSSSASRTNTTHGLNNDETTITQRGATGLSLKQTRVRAGNACRKNFERD